MKQIVFFLSFLFLSLASCQSKENQSQMNENDSLEIVVKIKNVMPIGWGYYYKAELLEVISGDFSTIDSTFKFSIIAGAKIENFMKPETLCRMKFMKTNRFNEKYITGLSDKENRTWELVELKD